MTTETPETPITNTETPETSAPHQYEPITNTTPIYPIKSGLAEAHPDMLRRSKERWPWKTMNEGDYVTVPAHMARKAQKAAHAYASLNGLKFSTKRDNLTGKMIIGRVPQKQRDWDIDPYDREPPKPIKAIMKDPRYKLIPINPKPTTTPAPANPEAKPAPTTLPEPLDTDQFPW